MRDCASRNGAPGDCMGLWPTRNNIPIDEVLNNEGERQDGDRAMNALRVGCLALTAIFACSGANAADMAAVFKAPPLIADPWNGFYVGVNAGGSVGQSATTHTTVIPGTAFPVFDNASYNHVPV